MKNYKELIKQGLDRNLVVYDSDAKPGVITPKLITLMQECMSKGPVREITQILTGEELDKYCNELDGCLAPHDSHILVAVHTPEEETQWDRRQGDLVTGRILTHTVLLGSY